MGEQEVKSLGREFTFEEDTSDYEFVFKTLDTILEEVYKKIGDSSLYFKTVTVKVRYEDFETHTHSKTLPFLTNRLKDRRKASRELIQPFLQSDRKIRLLGTRVSKLVSGEKQKTLTSS